MPNQLAKSMHEIAKQNRLTQRGPTNADRIRNMSDEELAEFIDEISGFQADYLQYRGEFIDAGDVLAWLRQEVHDGQTI